MEVFTVSLFGHRDFLSHDALEAKLEPLALQLLQEHEFVEFLIGRDGEFDIFAASIIHRLLVPAISVLVLVLPYETAEYKHNIKYFEDYYSEIEICYESAGAHFKAAHRLRNRSMLQRSDLALFWVERKSGGAYTALRDAEKLGIEYINLFQN